MRIGLFVLLALLPACGGSGEPEAPQAPPIEIHSVEGTLTTRTASPFEIHGVSFPGVIWTVVTICFDALEGTPLDGCRSATTEVSGVVRSSTLLQAQSPITELAGDTACRVTVSFPDGTVISSAGAIATLLGHADIRYDHDLDGEHDRCDPDTYDFEDDGIGERPAGTQRVDGDSPGFGVVDSGGDRAANYALATATGMHDTLDRLRCDVSHQDLTVFVDFDDTPQFAHVELWSDGSYLGNAGAGLLFQVQPNGALRLWQRIRRGLSSQAAGTLPASGRLRLRLAKGAGDASTLHVDTWEADMWSVDHAVFPIADDRWFTGREIALGEYGNSTRGIRRITAHRQGPPAALTIAECASTSASWKVFQRDATEAATIPVDCLYRLAAPGRLEARVVSAGTTDVLPGHDWADHALALAAAEDGRTQLPITDVPTGGNYDIEMRLVDTATDAVLGTDTLVEVAVGDLYLCIGQSNMAGYSHSLAGATPPLPQVHMFANSDTWMQAEEPVDNSLFQRDGVSAENPAHSLMLPFAAALFQATGVPVGIIPAPLGGTNLYAQWQRIATDPDHRGSLYGSALRRAALQGGAPLRGILWYQGESDAIGGRTKAQYIADLEQLVARYRSDLTAPDAVFLCVQLGTWSAGGYPNWTNIQEAQRQVCRADALAALATVHDQPRSDGIHYSVAGYQELGRRLADQARVLVFGHALDPLTELIEATSAAAGLAVELHYDATVQGGQPSLFEVTDAAGPNAVTGVSTAGSTVTLQLTRVLSGAATVRYGMSAVPAVDWVLDAQGVAVPAFADEPVGP